MDNIIECRLDSTCKEIYTGIWQHDYGQILRITGVDLPKAVEVQFSLRDKGGDTLTRIGTTVDGVTEVKVPDSFLKNENCTQNYLIYAWIYVTDDASGNTEYQIILHVKSRPKPEEPSEEPLPEPNIFHETVEAVNASADRAETAEKNAKASETEAGKYAASASESATAAEKTKEDALREVGEKKQEAIEAVQEQEETSVGKITTHTDDEIKRIQNQTVESKGELKQTIADADASKKELNESIQTAGDTKKALDKSTELAGTAKAALDTSIREAGEAKTALNGSAKTAGEMQETLNETAKQAGALDTSLNEKIETGTQLNEDITSSGEKAIQDIQNAGSEQLGKMQAVAEEFTADREQVAINKKDIDSLKEDLANIADACCEKKLVSKENYNLLKISEITYQSRLQNTSTEITSSNVNNIVSGWIPVEYGKYYTVSSEHDGTRVVTKLGASGTSPVARIQVRKKDGTLVADEYAENSLWKYSGSYSESTIKLLSADVEAIQIQINFGNDFDISTAELLAVHKIMVTSSDTHDKSLQKALNSEYMDGDAEGTLEVSYTLKSDKSKADKTDVEAIKREVSKINSRSISANQKYDSNFIPNERFIRGISNLRDEAKAKKFEITISNNSGSTIKNASIVVGLHNTVGINPDNNNLPFQVYDEMFSEPAGFKFFDGNTELPYYIESESDCNYIVDKNIKTDQKTMAVFSDGKIAVYNGTEARMQLSSDDGVSWMNVCDNITSRPYRVLLPDSQDNLFVASNDGKKLYKYTSADGYKAGTEVIDLTDTDTCIGSILAEDGDGNLYLGTYQTVFHCVIRKSTDHGDTWRIVFDVTNCQHVHNIFINRKVTPNEIFIGLDNSSGALVETHVSKDAGETWTKVDVPYGNRDYAFRYAGENFYIGCGERLYLGGSTLYKTTDYNNPDSYYPLFDNGQGIRDITNVIENTDDVLIAGGCVDASVHTEQLFLSEDRGETWKTVLMKPHNIDESPAGKGLRTFSRKGTQILSETSTGYCMRFVYGNGAKTTLAVVKVGDIPTSGKTITLKTGYVANIEQMDKVLTSYEEIDGKVADIQICDGYVIDKVSNKRVLTDETELCNYNTKLGQTSEYKILATSAYRLKGSVNLGKLSRLNFRKGFTVSLLFRKEEGKNYLEDGKYYTIFRSGNTRVCLWYRSIVLLSGDTNIFDKKLHINDAYLGSVNDDYVRVTFYVTSDELPWSGIFTENYCSASDHTQCASYPIADNLSEHDFIVGNDTVGYEDIPNIARIEIYNRVLTYGEIFSFTNGCKLITDCSLFN